MSELGSASPVTEFTGKCGDLWPRHRRRRSGDTRPRLGQSICRAPRPQPDTGGRIFPDRLAGDEFERYKRMTPRDRRQSVPRASPRFFPSEFYVMRRIVPRLCAAAISPRPPPGSTLRHMYGLASARNKKPHDRYQPSCGEFQAVSAPALTPSVTNGRNPFYGVGPTRVHPKTTHPDLAAW